MKVIGKYMVGDPEICHGKLTFRGTRVLAKDVLEQVASGMDWQDIIKDWDESISEEAIAEAIRLASEVLNIYVSDKLSEATN